MPVQKSTNVSVAQSSCVIKRLNRTHTHTLLHTLFIYIYIYIYRARPEPIGVRAYIGNTYIYISLPRGLGPRFYIRWKYLLTSNGNTFFYTRWKYMSKQREGHIYLVNQIIRYVFLLMPEVTQAMWRSQAGPDRARPKPALPRCLRYSGIKQKWINT